MRANEFLIEGVLDDIYATMLRDCVPFFSQVTHAMPMYRGQNDGMTRISPSLFKANTIPNRKPLDTDKFDHSVADAWFEDKTGVAYRSNHVAFCSGRRSSASTYGDMYVMVPIGDFTFCWSLLVPDLADAFPRSNVLPRIPENENKRFKQIIQTLDDAEYTTQNLTAAINSRSEIMVHCGSYYLLAIKLEQYEDLYFDIKDALNAG
jgi:hypothetical protein